ncbi:MAG: PIN domain-containing protein [bacterium]
MKDKFFLDSNIILYAFGKDNNKKAVAKELIRQRLIISVQVISEVSNILFKRFSFSVPETKNIFDFIKSKTEVKLINLKTIEYCFYIKEKYKFSYWDSLIIASALENQCLILYTEDMQNGQIIEERLVVVNPFLNNN